MNILIIEDEEAATRRLRKMLQQMDEGITVVDELDSVEAAANWLKTNAAPDLILLDIHLADGSGFELFRQVDVRAPVVFTTAFDKYAIEAFKVNAVDYLLKPIKPAELEQAIAKSRRSRSANPDYSRLLSALAPKPEKRFLVKVGKQIKVLETGDIAYFFTAHKITYAVTRSGKRVPLDESLESIEATVDEKAFFRINRQFIVGFEAIKNMYAYSKSRVKIELHPPCELDAIVSTERSPHFKKWLVGE